MASQFMVAIDAVVGTVIPWSSIKNQAASDIIKSTNRITCGGTNHSIVLKANTERS